MNLKTLSGLPHPVALCEGHGISRGCLALLKDYGEVLGGLGGLGDKEQMPHGGSTAVNPPARIGVETRTQRRDAFCGRSCTSLGRTVKKSTSVWRSISRTPHGRMHERLVLGIRGSALIHEFSTVRHPPHPGSSPCSRRVRQLQRLR